MEQDDSLSSTDTPRLEAHWEVPMNRFKFAAYCREFPCLMQSLEARRESRNSNRILDPEFCSSVRILRADEALSTLRPREYFWSGSVVGIAERDHLFVFSSEGSILGRVKPAYKSGSNYAHSGTYTGEGETVLEAIDRLLIDANGIGCIVRIESGKSVVAHYSTDEWTATIWKPSKEEAWSTWLEKARERASAEVGAEANF